MKIISGCQTGADEAGLAAALECNIPTGGMMPKGCKTLKGPRRDLLNKYNLTEHSSTSYKERTWDNVQASDGTMRFAYTFESAGEKCTLNALRNYNKPHLDLWIDLSSKSIKGLKASNGPTMMLTFANDQILYCCDWIYVNGIKILNVAGNSEETAPGIYEIVNKFLVKLFNTYKEQKYGNKSKGL